MSKIYDSIIIGSGAAGFGTAEWLYSLGIKNICIVTEGINCGTSRNTGSDKQTYYKPDFCSASGDSVDKMAADLMRGGAMNGSAAIGMAANSMRAFMRLVESGVPFPADEYGRFIGYKTDHDNTARATSAGPLTSKFMTEALESRVKKHNIEILDNHLAVGLRVNDGVCSGAFCLVNGDIKELVSKTVVLCTGAPAGIYKRSVYPLSQKGASGLAADAGADFCNFQEWQFGIASVDFRWNLSGSFQQVIPRYVSVSANGEETEFLPSPDDDKNIFTDVFLKGYQWPFDFAKINGSSRIDLYVAEQVNKRNKVYLDFRKNPDKFDYALLSPEAYEYLKKTDSFAVTPIERLKKLNPKAIKLYLDNGIDLENEMLRIDVCAQHNNGGIFTDFNCETTVKNLFAVGEAAGHFGVYRPGGSALNDTQTGGLLAAQKIKSALGSISVNGEKSGFTVPLSIGNKSADDIDTFFAEKMSEYAGVNRNCEQVTALLSELESLLNDFDKTVSYSDPAKYFYLRQTTKARIYLCRTILSSAENAGSRGGCVCTKGGAVIPENPKFREYVTLTDESTVSYRKTDDIPEGETVFEKLLKKQ